MADQTTETVWVSPADPTVAVDIDPARVAADAILNGYRDPVWGRFQSPEDCFAIAAAALGFAEDHADGIDMARLGPDSKRIQAAIDRFYEWECETGGQDYAEGAKILLEVMRPQPGRPLPPSYAIAIPADDYQSILDGDKMAVCGFDDHFILVAEAIQMLGADYQTRCGWCGPQEVN